MTTTLQKKKWSRPLLKNKITDIVVMNGAFSGAVFRFSPFWKSLQSQGNLPP